MIVFNIQHKMENFKSVIPTCSTASCPKCSRNVTLKKHANSGSIANMNDCLHHGFCENCSCPQHEFFVCIACLQHPSAWSYHQNCGILMSWKALNKHAKSPTHKNAMEYWHDQMHSQIKSKTSDAVLNNQSKNCLPFDCQFHG